MSVADDGLDSFLWICYLVQRGREFLVNEGSLSLPGMFEDQAGEGNRKVRGDDDCPYSPPGRAAQGSGEDSGEAGQQTGERGRVHRVDALPARDG
ncbi:hypothetical protein ACFUEN_35740 [Streptomyces griseorubiginosus]|uniref:hypothetical protein n=1 Tax=Streptomyces griseorubiginosus TaxID=67304 RepID=UPI00364412F5